MGTNFEDTSNPQLWTILPNHKDMILAAYHLIKTGNEDLREVLGLMPDDIREAIEDQKPFITGQLGDKFNPGVTYGYPNN